MPQVKDQSKAEEFTSQKSRALRKGRYRSKRRGPISGTNNKDPRRE